MHGAHHFCTFMAPALIEAAATVSQSSTKKFDFINTHLLEDLASDLARIRGISTTTTGHTFERSSGRSTTQVANTAIKFQIENNKNIDNSLKVKEDMNIANGKEKTHNLMSVRLLKESESFDQSSGPIETMSTSETCALSDVEGGKRVGCRSQPLAEAASYKMLKERTKANESKVQVLERRARNLKHRLRSFQTSRLLSHVKTQAQLLDYSNKASHDPRSKTDPDLIGSTDSNQEPGKNLPLFNETVETSLNSLTTSNPKLTSLLRSDLQQIHDIDQKGQAPTSGPKSCINAKDNELSKITLQDKKDVFGVLTNSVKEVMKLDDPDATDPESDNDDNVERPLASALSDGRKHDKL